MSSAHLKDNLARVRDRIDAACARAGRRASDVTLVAVTKYASDADVEAILELGVRDLGESRAVEGAARVRKFGPDVRWHFIGHLQTNKAAKVVEAFHFLHSLDRKSLAEELEKRCAAQDKKLAAFLQVNVSGEATKGGFHPFEVERERFLLHLDLLRVRVCGLMTMAPAGPPESARPIFRYLRELAQVCMVQRLSMGMSDDFDVAIEEGATHIRVGTALFGSPVGGR